MKDQDKTQKQPTKELTQLRRRIVELEKKDTERKQAEEALRESEERYRVLFEEARDGIALADADTGILLDCNQALADLIGRKRAELIGQHQAILHPPSSNNTGLSTTFKKHLTNKKGQVLETQVLTVTGEIREVEIKANLLYLQGRKMLQGIFRDITERKQAEEALRKSEEKYRSIIENMQEGYFENDLAGNFIFFNDALCRIIGYPREELIGKNNRQYTDEKTAKKIYQVYNRIYRTGEPSKGIEEEYIRKDGTKLFAELSVSLISDAEGKPIGFRGIARDVTERKRAEEALQRSYHQLRESLITTVNTLASTIELRDPYTAGHQRRVTILACAIAEDMGLPEAQFDGLRLAGLVHDIGKFTVPVEILNKPGRITETEFNIIKTHAEAGYNVLKEIEFPWPVARIVLQHHERLDGSGYPQRLKDAGIMPEAKILAVADVVEAMASHRPYRPALGIEAALHEISMNKGILYDPDATDICLRLFTKKGFALKQEL